MKSKSAKEMAKADLKRFVAKATKLRDAAGKKDSASAQKFLNECIEFCHELIAKYGHKRTLLAQEIMHTVDLFMLSMSFAVKQTMGSQVDIDRDVNSVLH